MSSSSSAARDRVEVRECFGFAAGLVVPGAVAHWTPLTRPESQAPLKAVVALHAGQILLHVFSGAGGIPVADTSNDGRTVGLWFIATATGAVSVNSVAYGPFWTWSSEKWVGYFSLMAIASTPVFSRPAKRKEPG